MRRADRLFDIIQRLRTARGPMTAAALAEELEVTVRTVYRDVATLQARRVPIEGAAGIGYVLRRGFDLPAADVHNVEEIEAIAVGARWWPYRRSGITGRGRERAVESHGVLPECDAHATGRGAVLRLRVRRAGAEQVDLSAVRQASAKNASSHRLSDEKARRPSDRSGRSRSPTTCRRR